MFSRPLFDHSAALMASLVSRLIFSHWARDYEEHHGSCEDAYAARIGPLHLEVNRCFVLDHDDAFISLHVPISGGKLCVGYVVCLGEDEIRRPGFYAYRQKRLPKVVTGQACPPVDDDDFPF